ncbi:MAG TPA: hypothetical protein VK585_03970 [Jiangellaceae bacterium]|nr:hypothetical protein [Jiangellaceae bacterium]
MSEPVASGGTGNLPRQPDLSATRVVAETALVSLALGLVAGLVWWLVAPEVLVGVRDGSPVLIAAEARSLFGVDASFAGIGAVAGLLVGAAMFTRHRGHPTAMLAGLVLAGAAGSWVAWQVGSALGPGPLDARVDGAADGATLAIPLDLSATGVVLSWPIMAVVVTLVVVAFTQDLPPRNRSRGSGDRADGGGAVGGPDGGDVSRGERSEPWSPR